MIGPRDLFDAGSLFYEGKRPRYTVGEISRLIKQTVEGAFAEVEVRGEISGLKSATSGHIYFNLKDDGAILRAICWKSLAAKLNFKLEDGAEVIATGKISTYEGQSNYQLIISKIEIAGQGALLALLQKRKEQLEKEGLFDAQRKQAIPFLPLVIGVVTSQTGAVIRDILHRISDRMGVNVIVWPVLVQGAEAANQIANAILGFSDFPKEFPKPDLIIVARGGGSTEDLWAFNEEIVVRAAADCKIPLISAIGHETDTTLIDFVADRRAPTPTAAAEIAVPVKADLISGIEAKYRRLEMSLINFVERYENRLLNASSILLSFSQRLQEHYVKVESLSHSLSSALERMLAQKERAFHRVSSLISKAVIKSSMESAEIKLANLEQKLGRSITLYIEKIEEKITVSFNLLQSYSYEKTLERGFAIVESKNGCVLKTKTSALLHSEMRVKFIDGVMQIKNANREEEVCS